MANQDENALRDLWINFNRIRHKEVEIKVQPPSANREELLDELEDLWMLLALHLRGFMYVYPERKSDPRVFNIINQLIRDRRLRPSPQ
jgi:hypothetical protein